MTLLILVWLNGAFSGALAATVWIYWHLATGRRDVRPLDKL